MLKTTRILLLIGMLLPFSLFAQVACPYVTANNDTIGCYECTNLSADFFGGGATTNYNVVQVPYTPSAFTGGTAVLVNIDDTWSGVIALPFPFCFYGQTYNQFVIGSNGIISFDLTNANGYCEWNFAGATPLPSASANLANLACRNAIMGPYHDTDPSVGGDINYQIIGTAPCRRLVVNWNQIPMFSCNNLISTQQTILYETTNVIETYSSNKPVCNSWNTGKAVHAIQNATGTVAHVVPGRNFSSYSVTNDAWRFEPSGAPTYVENWYQNGVLIGTGSNIQVCPGTTTDYTVEIIYDGCAGLNPYTAYDTATIFVDTTTLAFNITTSDVTCNGLDNGTGSVSINGGSLFSYTWSPNVSSTANASNLPPGSYTIVVTDLTNNCTGTDSFLIAEPTALSLNPSSSNIDCNGNTNGTASVIANGGIGNYTYTWNTMPPQNTTAISGLDIGSYTITVHDSNNCEIQDTITITEPLPLTLQITTTPETCNNVNGTATATVTGGTGPFVYSWNGIPTPNSVANNLTGGNYVLIVEDSNGCTITQNFTVAAPIPVSIASVSTQNVTCFGGNDGTATVQTLNGTAPFSYNWSGGMPFGNICSGLIAGGYNIQITDANGCIANQGFIIQQPTQMVVLGAPQVNILCNGATTGSASIIVNGGIQPYQYSWTGAQGSGNSISSIGAGNYSVFVTDANSCVLTQNYIITDPPALSAIATGDTVCLGQGGGTGTVTVSGGVAPYIYNWTPNVTANNSASGLSSGNYSILITDANGCTLTSTLTILESGNPTITTVSVVDVACFGENTGSIQTTIQGGTPPYAFNWVGTSGNGSYVNSLYAGNYGLNIVDFYGCTASQNMVVTQPLSALTASAQGTNLRCYGLAEGEAVTVGQGGTPPYSYKWNSNPLQYNDTAYNLLAGNYLATITDAHNCTATASVEISQPPMLAVYLDRFKPSFCGLPNAFIEVRGAGGTNSLQYSWTINNDTDTLLNDVYAGTYRVYVSDENNCMVSKEFSVGDIPQATAKFTSDPLDFPQDSTILDYAFFKFYNESEGANSYKWFVGDVPFSGLENPTYRFKETGFYQVSLIAYNGSELCPDTAKKTYFIIPAGQVFVPNSFTPNGDGANDLFYVDGNRITSFQMQIFDRWGKEMISFSDLRQTWDGMKDGQDVPEGTYAYILRAVANNGQLLKRSGTIILVR